MIYELDSYVRLLSQTKKRVYIVATGAGAGLQQRLWKVPGASSFLAGASLPYSKEAQDEVLGFTPEHFVTPDVALAYAISAYLKADNGDPDVEPIGLALTAVVATGVQHRGDHRIHAAVVTSKGVLATDVILPKDGADMRIRDGLIADTIGYELLMAGAGILSPETIEAHRKESDGKTFRDATLDARRVLFERPLFTRFGRRLPAPQGNVLLFPGAFNPPHEGHFANAANATARASGEPALFQITASPPHKAALSLTDMLGRLRHFKHKHDVLFMEGGALYIEKARRFPNSTFVLGSDALSRMLDPQWGVEPEALLREFQELGTKFLISERDSDTLRDIMLKKVPVWAYDLFYLLPTTPYRSLSSTQIREAAAQKSS